MHWSQNDSSLSYIGTGLTSRVSRGKVKLFSRISNAILSYETNNLRINEQVSTLINKKNINSINLSGRKENQEYFTGLNFDNI